jgi:SAM-dependent methyltransferase
MAHYQQLQFVKELSASLPTRFEHIKVLEVGSWDVNGSIRSLFKNCDYVGADIADGPGVDLVCNGESIDLPDCHFDVVISCECFEHNSGWKETFQNMNRMLKPGGLCIVTCATLSRSEHGTTRTSAGASLTALNNYPDYYRNLKPADFKQNFNLKQLFSEHFFCTNSYSRDLYFVGVKHGGVIGHSILSERVKASVSGIRRDKPTGYFKRFRLNAKFLYRYTLARMLGERTYHNLMHRMRQKNKRDEP